MSMPLTMRRIGFIGHVIRRDQEARAQGTGRWGGQEAAADRDFRILLSQFQLFSTPARALAETLTLERTLSDLVNRAHALTPAEIVLMWQTTSPRRSIPRET